jgi:hypothetical protein
MKGAVNETSPLAANVVGAPLMPFFYADARDHEIWMITLRQAP